MLPIKERAVEMPSRTVVTQTYRQPPNSPDFSALPGTFSCLSFFGSRAIINFMQVLQRQFLDELW